MRIKWWTVIAAMGVSLVLNLVVLAADATPEWISAAAGLAQTIILLSAAVIAGQELKDARRDREERDRPIVVVDLDPHKRARKFFLITVTNHGRTVAKDVTFTFNPRLGSTLDGKMRNQPDLADLPLFQRGLKQLAPGKTLSTLFDHLPDRRNCDLPAQYEGKVTYFGPSGKEWTDDILLDVDLYKRLTYLADRERED